MRLWNNVYFVRFRSGMRYYILNSIINHIPSWTVRKIFYRLFGVKMGYGCRIGLYTIIDYPRGIILGDRSIVNEMCFLDGRGGLEIGSDVSISMYTKIITASHDLKSNSFAYYESSVVIENNVWIGVGAIILDGSTIHQMAIIGAGCIFKGNAVEQGVYIGNPPILKKIRSANVLYQLDYRPWCR